MSDSEKYLLDDVTFLIGLRIDSADRLRNVLAVTNWLLRTYSTRIIVGVENLDAMSTLLPDGIDIHLCDGGMDLPFHSTRMFNSLARMVTTPIMVQLDADVIIPPSQLMEAVRRLRNDEADVVLPFEYFHSIPKIVGLHFLSNPIQSETAIGTRTDAENPMGGCIVRRMTSFVNSGMENERLIAWGPEDIERIERARILGDRIFRIPGPLFHLEHSFNELSQRRHAYGINSWLELERIQTLSRDELKTETSTWPWMTIESNASLAPVAAADLTVTIPVRLDSPERLNNLIACTNALVATTTARILVGIANPRQLDNLLHERVEIIPIDDVESEPFHRTRILNDLARIVTTTYIANLDADVVVPHNQWAETIQTLREELVGLVIPYDGRMVSVSWGHHPWLERADYASMPIVNRRLMHAHSVGGCVVWNRADFQRVGMENENLVSWGFDDDDRVHRALTLGIGVRRIDGVIYHLDHPRGPDSSRNNSSYTSNEKEFKRMKRLGREELIHEISSWTWREAHS
jgi:predicted glycosyltransferase involved in capsule biosynthesis